MRYRQNVANPVTCQEGCRVEHLTVNTAACRSTRQDIIVLNKLSVRATRIASFLLPVPLLAGVAVLGMPDMDRSQAAAERICSNELPGLSAGTAALTLANEGS
jgi:hypothetical protein